ncbi:unnamed protein product, partial [Didymodactylos carnosus]
MIEMVRNHLSTFGINTEQDLVGSTQDGAAVNKKFMGMLNIIGQFCLNHGIHLAVCDVSYEKVNTSENLTIDVGCDDEKDDDEFDDGCDLEIAREEISDEINYYTVLKAARDVIKYIKNSTVRNQIFQSKVNTQFRHDVELHLDVQHRWNLIPIMLGSLLKTKLCLFETFTELNALDLINKLDFKVVEELQEAMAPIKLAVENLSKENSNLLTADFILEFIFGKLENLKSTISLELHECLKKRIEERMNSDVMSLLKCLNDPSNVPSKNIINLAGKLSQRLFGSKNGSEEVDQPEQQESQDNIPLQDELNLFLQRELSSSFATTTDEFKWLKQEFLLFKNTGKRTENLQKLFDALLCIKPTSTDI